MNGIATMLVVGIAAVILLIGVGIWSAVDYFFVEDTYKSKKPITPDVVIESKTVNGIQTADTTYVYHLK